jgi:hypothetical protein
MAFAPYESHVSIAALMQATSGSEKSNSLTATPEIVVDESRFQIVIPGWLLRGRPRRSLRKSLGEHAGLVEGSHHAINQAGDELDVRFRNGFAGDLRDRLDSVQCDLRLGLARRVDGLLDGGNGAHHERQVLCD